MVDRILAGDEESFRIIVQRYANFIYRAVYGVLHNSKDAEDVVQEAFLQIHLSFSTYERKGLKTWMSRIAIHKAIDWKRRQLRRQEQSLPDSLDGLSVPLQGAPPGTEVIALERERRQRIAQNIKQLPDTYREVIIAYYIEEKSYQQIAQQFGLELKSVESRLYRAKQWMRKHWKEEDFG